MAVSLLSGLYEISKHRLPNCANGDIYNLRARASFPQAHPNHSQPFQTRPYTFSTFFKTFHTHQVLHIPKPPEYSYAFPKHPQRIPEHPQRIPKHPYPHAPYIVLSLSLSIYIYTYVYIYI